MANLAEITATDRELLKKTLSYLELTQKELSENLKLNPSWLSQVIKGKITNTNEENFKTIAEFLVQRAGDFRKNKNLTDEHIYEIAGFLSRFSRSAKDLIPAKIFPPGEIIPITAKNYVERSFDEEILAAFQNDVFTLLVKGPTQVGKTSLLVNLENTAKNKGLSTLWFDPKKEIPTNAEFKNGLELNKLLVKALGLQLQREWNLPTPLFEEDSSDPLANLISWIKIALTPSKFTKRVLIIDDLGRVGATVAESWFRQIIRELQNERGKSGATESLSIAVGISYGFHEKSDTVEMLDFSMVHWSNEVSVGWFTENEVIELTRKMEVELTKGANLHELFGGHPYLTSVALYDNDFLQANIKWNNKKSKTNADAIRQMKPYKLLLNAARRAIWGPKWDDPKAKEDFLINLYLRYKGRNFKNNKTYEQFLIESKFLNFDNTPTISLYHLIVEDIRNEIDGEPS
jgi:hypothetical protein